MIYLDNAATTFPKPESVYQVMDQTFRQKGVNPGRGSYRIASELGHALAQSREALAQFFGAKNPSRIIFAYSATDALNMALKGILKSGDHVISTILEHNAMVRPLCSLEKDRKIQVSWVSCTVDGHIEIDAIRKAITPKTRMIAITHASNVVGTVLPLEDIAQISK